MTRISSFAIYQCPDCKLGHILPNYASISVTVATDAYVPENDLRICSGCGSVNQFKKFVYIGSMQKPVLDRTPSFIKFVKRLFGRSQPEPVAHPVNIFPYLNPKSRSKI